jgi:hypothetical protein
MKTICLGAIKKQTGEYVYPKIANKIDKYICPECNKDLILCQGEIRNHHFRHKNDTIIPCNHYSSPTETQIHKDAKILLKTLLESKIPISFIRSCACCKKNDEYEIPEITETSNIKLEYRFEYNGLKIADVTYIDNNEILCIFEIYNTHKTCSENRPEPWFEIEALSLIQKANDPTITSLKIICIRNEKCNECIQKEKENTEKKKLALDILYNWLQTGVEIYPFLYDYAEFAGINKNIKAEFTDECVDLILYVEPSEKFERYHIQLIYNSSSYYFTKELEYGEDLKGIYYLDIDWILSQTKIPERIKYIASLDCYDYRDHHEFYKTCVGCKDSYSFWVKRINDLTPDYKVISIGCQCGYNSDTEYINCEKCNSNDTPLCVMETNTISIHICKSCDIELFSSDNIYLKVSFNEKDEVKKLGANWDNKYKKWFINKHHKNKDVILQKWRRIW